MSLLMSPHSSCIVRIMRFKLASFIAALKESPSLFPPIAYSWIFFTEVVLVASYSFVSKTKYYYNIICLYELHFFLKFFWRNLEHWEELAMEGPSHFLVYTYSPIFKLLMDLFRQICWDVGTGTHTGGCWLCVYSVQESCWDPPLCKMKLLSWNQQRCSCLTTVLLTSQL